MTATTDFLAGVTVEGSDNTERQASDRESGAVAERLAGMAARRSGGHECKGGTYFTCLDRNHRRDRHNAGYLLRMILTNPEETGLPGQDDYDAGTGWASMTNEEAKALRNTMR